ncbi:Solute carrier family 22 member 15 [Nymphon striatum]|nr:Solute carrier family 22 member 15 [Nymphon striatum]
MEPHTSVLEHFKNSSITLNETNLSLKCGAEQALFIMACEVLPSRYRSTSVAGLFLFYAIGDLLLCLQAYLLVDWRQLQIAISIGVVCLLPCNFWLPETPHWLASVGQYKQAENYFRQAAKMNNVKLPKNFSLKKPRAEESEDEGSDEVDEETKRKEKFRKSIRIRRETKKKDKEAGVHTVHAHVGHFGELFKALSNKMLFKDAMISSFVWACSAYMYYGLTVSSVQPGKDIYVNFMLTGLSMLPAFPLSTYVLGNYRAESKEDNYVCLEALFQHVGVDTPISPLNNHPGFLGMILNERQWLKTWVKTPIQCNCLCIFDSFASGRVVSNNSKKFIDTTHPRNQKLQFVKVKISNTVL